MRKSKATLDLRTVKGMNPRRTANRLIEHARAQGFFVVDREPTPGERTSMRRWRAS